MDLLLLKADIIAANHLCKTKQYTAAINKLTECLQGVLEALEKIQNNKI